MRPRKGRPRVSSTDSETCAEDFDALGAGGEGEGEDEKMWKDLFDELYRKLRAALQRSELEPRSAAASVSIVRQVLQEVAMSVIKDTGRKMDRMLRMNAQGPLFVPLEVKDVWGISSLYTLIGFENEDGRHCRFFPVGTRGSVREVLHTCSNHSASLESAKSMLLCEGAEEDPFGAHPREFIAYAFTVTMSGIRYLEREAQMLWGEALTPPINVNRRYSEFFDLQKNLAEEYKYRIGASSKVRLILVPSLPPKDSFSLRAADNASFVNERRRSLEVWLRYVSLHRIMSISAPFRKFILEPEVMGDTDSFSAGSSVRSFSASVQFHSAASSVTRSTTSMVRLSREDPLVARRAKVQVEEALEKYGSGPVALNAIHTLIPSLQSALLAAKRSIDHVVRREDELKQSWEELGVKFLKLSQTNQLEGREGIKVRMRLDPLNYAGMALERTREEHLAAECCAMEAYHATKYTIKLWSHSILPKMKSLVSYLYSSDINGSHHEEPINGVTPQERLAAEWHEMSQIRSSMFAKAAEDLVQAQIMIAAERRNKWEQLKAKLLRFDVDAYLAKPSEEVNAWEPYTDLRSFADVLRHHDSGSPDPTRTAPFEHREAQILERQRKFEEAKRQKEEEEQQEVAQRSQTSISEANSRRPPPPVPRTTYQSRNTVGSDNDSFESSSSSQYHSLKKPSVTFSDTVRVVEHEPFEEEEDSSIAGEDDQLHQSSQPQQSEKESSHKDQESASNFVDLELDHDMAGKDIPKDKVDREGSFSLDENATSATSNQHYGSNHHTENYV